MRIYLLLILFLAAFSRSLASPFQNLGFDDANTSNLIPSGGFFYNPPHQNVGYGTAGDMLPGWHVLYGSVPYSDPYWLNLNSVGGALVSLYDKNNYLYDPTVVLPVEGKFSFSMEADALAPLSVVQTGDVPADAQTLNFTSFGREVEVRINGSLVPVQYTYGPTPINLNTRIARGMVDVSGYDGQTIDLSFRTLSVFGTGATLNGLDSIFFSPVPEPGTFGLLGIGMAFLGMCCWLQKRRV